VSAGDSRVAAPPGFGHRTWRGLGSTDLATRRRNREHKDKVDSSSRAGDRRETVGSSIWRTEGARAGGWWRECAGLTEGDRRGAGEAGGRSVGCDASGRPTVAREGGRREGSGARDGGVRPGRSGGSSSSSTAGLPLDREESIFDFRCKDLGCKESKS
jgi:hypothetical protein